MKKKVFIAICIVNFLVFSSCGSTSRPCGLANKTKEVKNYQPSIIIAEATVK